MRKILLIALSLSLLPVVAFATSHEKDATRKLADSQVKAWTANAAVIDAIRAQNSKHAGLTQAEIDALDKQWRAETGASGGPLMDGVLAAPLSKYLAGVKKEGAGLFTEIFVMDNRGLNVGQSDPTSDYWQGDEAKWKKTFLAGPDAVFVDDVEFDESTQSYQSQLSMAISDPDTGEVIGSITVGVNVELLTN